MKVYFGKNQLLLTGKAWEINNLLKQYCLKYTYVKEWIEDGRSTNLS